VLVAHRDSRKTPTMVGSDGLASARRPTAPVASATSEAATAARKQRRAVIGAGFVGGCDAPFARTQSLTVD
jgi:hypothetical protein